MCIKSQSDFWIILPIAKFHLTYSVYDATDLQASRPKYLCIPVACPYFGVHQTLAFLSGQHQLTDQFT